MPEPDTSNRDSRKRPFEKFYELKKEFLRKLVFSKVGSDELEDICQEVWNGFSKVFQERPESENTAFLAVMAKRRIADHYRKESSRNSAHDRYRQFRDVFEPASRKLLGKSNTDLKKAFEACLTEEELSFILAKFVEGKSFRKMAEDSEKSSSRIAEIVSTALCKLRNYLEK